MVLTLIKEQVVLVLSKSIYKCMHKVEVVSERIQHATLHGNPRLSITVMYAPTECGPTTAKDNFYTSLAEQLEQRKGHETLCAAVGPITPLNWTPSIVS